MEIRASQENEKKRMKEKCVKWEVVIMGVRLRRLSWWRVRLGFFLSPLLESCAIEWLPRAKFGCIQRCADVPIKRDLSLVFDQSTRIITTSGCQDSSIFGPHKAADSTGSPSTMYIFLLSSGFNELRRHRSLPSHHNAGIVSTPKS